MMNIEEIDRNFALNTIKEPDVEWHRLDEPAFSLTGVYYDEGDACYRRAPRSLGESIDNPQLVALSAMTSGGRFRFRSDSPYVALRAVIPKGEIMHHMPIAGQFGFGGYVNGAYFGVFDCGQKTITEAKGTEIAFETIRPLHTFATAGEINDFDFFFPLYNDVIAVFVGIKQGATLLPPKPLTVEKPIVFYGSSITQGGCASHPGNDYAGMLARWLDANIVNLGFSGNGKGELPVANYLADIDASVMVLDYDHNSNLNQLKERHYPFYRAIREKKPELPIILISKPDFENGYDNRERRAVIRATYENALTAGDRYIDFIDGETLFGTRHRECFTVDTTHPNDAGFFRMAECICPVIEKWL